MALANRLAQVVTNLATNAHGGEISVRSSAADGTTLTVKIPPQAAAQT